LINWRNEELRKVIKALISLIIDDINDKYNELHLRYSRNIRMHMMNEEITKEIIDILAELIEYVRDIERDDWNRDKLYELSRKLERL